MYDLVHNEIIQVVVFNSIMVNVTLVPDLALFLFACFCTEK